MRASWGDGPKGGRLIESGVFPDRVITKANAVILVRSRFGRTCGRRNDNMMKNSTE